MYKNLGYIVYRTVIDYYAGPGDVDEDAYGKYEWSLNLEWFWNDFWLYNFRYEESNAPWCW